MLFSLIGWAGSLLLIYALWMVGNKKRYSFLLSALAEILILVQSVHLRNWPIVFLGGILALLAGRNYIAWGKEETPAPAVVTGDYADDTNRLMDWLDYAMTFPKSLIARILTVQEVQQMMIDHLGLNMKPPALFGGK